MLTPESLWHGRLDALEQDLKRIGYPLEHELVAQQRGLAGRFILLLSPLFNELEKLRDSRLEELEEALERKYGNPSCEHEEVEDYMRCPRCGDARLHRYNYTYVSRVSIDRCSRCYGVWLDDGELNAIITEQKTMQDADAKGRLGAFLGVIKNLV